MCRTKLGELLFSDRRKLPGFLNRMSIEKCALQLAVARFFFAQNPALYFPHNKLLFQNFIDKDSYFKHNIPT